jgi:hypothetical protein
MACGETGVSAAIRSIARLYNSVAVMEVARRPGLIGDDGSAVRVNSVGPAARGFV